MEQTGVRIESTRYEVISPTERIRPLRDQILFRPLPWQPSGTIQIAGDGQRTRRRGIVIAIGPGCYPKRYNRERSKTWDSQAFRRTEVKVGDTIELGGPCQDSDWAFPGVLIGTELHILCREEDVTGIVTECNTQEQ